MADVGGIGIGCVACRPRLTAGGEWRDGGPSGFTFGCSLARGNRRSSQRLTGALWRLMERLEGIGSLYSEKRR